MKYHSETIPSAIERYQKETLRVFSVLDGVLAKSPSGYLVGDKVTIADLAFVSWNKFGVEGIVSAVDGVDVEKQFPAFYACVPLSLLVIGARADKLSRFVAGTRRSTRAPRSRRCLKSMNSSRSDDHTRDMATLVSEMSTL